jgi:hypothetical protein
MSQIFTRLHGVSSLKEFSSDGAKNPLAVRGFYCFENVWDR